MIERITHVVSLFVGEEKIRAQGKRHALIRLHIDARGYVQGYELRESSQVREFDEAIEPILHLAEPFPVSERTYEFTLPFAVR
ncbi:MAG: TonB C-terminal domain-containing protein [Myxococcaceae bacterium]|nr:TonB C-terminal domain-containing protein [Myxococcaceae bacterium]